MFWIGTTKNGHGTVKFAPIHGNCALDTLQDDHRETACVAIDIRGSGEWWIDAGNSNTIWLMTYRAILKEIGFPQIHD